MKRPPFLARAAASALAAAALFASCREHGEVGDANEYVVARKSDMPAGVPFASDENYRKFIEADAASKVEVRDDRALVVDPATGDAQRGDAADLHLPPGDDGRADGARPPLARAAGRRRRAGAEGPRPPPGLHRQNYFLRLTNAADPKDHAYTAVLSVMSYTPDAAIWSKAMSGRSGAGAEGHPVARHLPQRQRQRGPFVATRAVSVKVGP